MKRRVFFDVDGTLCDLMGPFVDKYNEQHGTNIDISGLTEYDFDKLLPIKPESIQDIFASIHYDDVKPFQPMVDAIKLIDEAGYEVIIVTAPMWDHCFQLSQKKVWLEEKVGHHIPVVVTMDKGILCRAGDILIDDAPRFLEQWIEQGGVAIRVKQPWNTEYSNANYSVSVDEYAGHNILNFINRLSPQKWIIAGEQT